MTDADDLDHRVSVLEGEVARLREMAALTASDAAAARVLAGGADRDVSGIREELRAHRQALNALRETQLEQGQALADQGQRMAEGFATLGSGMAQITALLEGLTGSEND